MHIRFLTLLVALAGCTKHNPGSDCRTGMCTDPAYPYCDSDGAISGDPGACIAVACIPGDIATCDQDKALTCNTGGNGYDSIACVAGCIDTPTPHCAYLAPKYLPDICDTRATDAALDISSSGMFDPTFDANCTGGVVPQPGAPSICVVHYGAISIDQGIELDVAAASMATRSVALVADDDVTIAGTLDVSSRNFLNGPGGGYTTSGGAPNTASGFGGGGAGFHTKGGSGGSSNQVGGANNGGPATFDPALNSFFAGGPAGTGGAGGGAVMLVSCRGTVSIPGMVAANGGGAIGGVVFSGTPTPGGGGGAGGYVVLQGLTITVTGQIYANGGGGGGGTFATATLRYDGADGRRSDTLGAAGGQPTGGAGRGGDGAVASGVPNNGNYPTTTGATAGGGGGSVGFLQSYTPAGIVPTLAPTHASPPFQPNMTVATH